MVVDSSLPGEHGFHNRDGSLTKKKQEQWQKEKSENKCWFPFGTQEVRTSCRSKPGTPVRTSTDTGKSYNISDLNPENRSQAVEYAISGYSGVYAPSNNPTPSPSQQIIPNAYSLSNKALNGRNEECLMIPNSSDVPSSVSQQPLYSAVLPQHHQSPNQLIYPAVYNHATGGFVSSIPINSKNGTLHPQFYLPQNCGPYELPNPAVLPNPALWQFHPQFYNVDATTYMPHSAIDYKAHNGYAMPFPSNVQENFNSLNGSEFSLTDDFLKQTRRKESNLGAQEDVSHYDKAKCAEQRELSVNKQLAERKRFDEVYAEKERLELQRVKEIHDEQERRHQVETEKEVKKMKMRQESIDAKEKAYLESIEKAKVESEVLRKAKLFKHILFNADTTEETIFKVLGTNDTELCKSVLKEVGALERQKRIDFENLNYSNGSASVNENTSVLSTPISSARKGVKTNTSSSIIINNDGFTKKTSQIPICNGKQQNKFTVCDKTPLTRSAFGRGSMRVSGSPKIAPLLSNRQQSGSTERLDQEKKNDRFAHFPSTSKPLLNRSLDVGQRPKQFSPLTLLSNSESKRLFRTDENLLRKNVTNVTNKSNYQSSQRSQNGLLTTPPRVCRLMSATSSNSADSLGTVIVEDSTFAVDDMPHVLNIEVLNSPPKSMLQKLAKKLPPIPPPKPKSFAVPKANVNCKKQSSQLNQNDEANSVCIKNGEEKLHVDTGNLDHQPSDRIFSFDQRLSSLSLGLNHYESLISTFSPIICLPNPSSNGASALSHNEAMRCLAKLPTDEMERAGKMNISKNMKLGLFEPVKTRQKMRQDLCQSELPQQNFSTIDDRNVELGDNANFETDCHRKGSSAGASSNATASDSLQSSPISYSPPLSGQCKSIFSSSPFENAMTVSPKSKTSLQFKALLRTPSGSREELRAEFCDKKNTNERPPATPFAMKLAESGSRRQVGDFYNNSGMLRRNLRSPRMMLLQESLTNLSVEERREISPTEKNLLSDSSSGTENANNGIENQSRPITPKPFNCRAMQYRSFNLKKNSERQHRILEQLANVRAQLKDRQEKIERTFSNQNLSQKNSTNVAFI